MSGNAEACRAHNGWGCFITGENVTRPPEGVFLPVYMDRCEDLTGRPFEHVTPAHLFQISCCCEWDPPLT